MQTRNRIFWALLLSFVMGLSLVTAGLASLPPAYQQPRTVLLNPNLENISKELPTQKPLDTDTVVSAPPPPPPMKNKYNHVIRSGQTLAGILSSYGVGKDEVARATNDMQKHFRLSDMRAGETIFVEFFDDKDGKHIKEIKFKPSVTKTVRLYNDDKGEFQVETKEIQLQKVILKATGEIRGSFYESTLAAGVTPAVISQLIKALSYDVDFQRDIQPGNKFSILYEGYTSPEGEFIKSNRPLYVKLQMKKKTSELFIIAKMDGTLGYFHADAANAKKALLKTPMDASRITSGFGMRRHPVLGYSKMHKGTDFGAPTGTPIYAAGDGVIQTAGWSGGYGNLVVIKHNNTYSTAYGHTSRFGPGIKPGVSVKQGQIIAYVGTTGRSTGPHLHYEVRVNGQQVNPISVKLPMVSKLAGADLKKFNDLKKQITTALSNAPTRADLAQLIEEEEDDKVSEDGEQSEQSDSPDASAPAIEGEVKEKSDDTPNTKAAPVVSPKPEAPAKGQKQQKSEAQ